MTADLPRTCTCAQGDPLMQAYHDRELGVPVRDPRLLSEMLVLEGFQEGLSLRTSLYQREGFRRAFDGFDPAIVADYGPDEVDALMQVQRIIRARAKIEAAIGNARVVLGMLEAGEDFADFIWVHVGGQPIVGDGARSAGQHPGVSDQGAQSQGVQIRGCSHRLCLHAGGGDG